MRISVPHVQKRGDALFFRLAVPPDLPESFGSKRELTRTLLTGDPMAAAGLARSLAQGFGRRFKQLRQSKRSAERTMATTMEDGAQRLDRVKLTELAKEYAREQGEQVEREGADWMEAFDREQLAEWAQRQGVGMPGLAARTTTVGTEVMLPEWGEAFESDSPLACLRRSSMLAPYPDFPRQRGRFRLF